MATTMTREPKATARYLDQYTALKAKMNVAFDRWAAATPAAEQAAADEYHALLQQMRTLTARRQGKRTR